MDRPDLLSRVQQRGRLHGPNESRRALRAVIDALLDAVPAGPSRRLAMRVATETGAGLAESALDDRDVHGGEAGCRGFVLAVARRLYVDEAEAAFLARVVFGELNAAEHGITPAAVAPLAPPDLRPLLGARAEADQPARPGEPAHRFPASPPIRIRLAGAPSRSVRA